MSEHTLYRFFDRDGVLLYVGRTIAPSRRWREHERRAPWFGAVASVTRELHTSAEAVARAERTAIADEGPLHNVVGNRRRDPRPQPVAPQGEWPDSLIARWMALDPGAAKIEPVTDCDGDETMCECAACHGRRLRAIEEYRAWYEWHPDIDGEITAVEARYYGGWDLVDWYYDLFDIGIFARMRLIGESQQRPLPAYVQVDGGIATVECTFCMGDHRYYLAPGMLLDQTFDAACDRMAGGKYVLVADYEKCRDELFRWGDASAAKGRAA